jgi:hypothetical protein
MFNNQHDLGNTPPKPDPIISSVDGFIRLTHKNHCLLDKNPPGSDQDLRGGGTAGHAQAVQRAVEAPRLMVVPRIIWLRFGGKSSVSSRSN